MTNNRILFIDAYDSFSNNITTLLEAELSVFVETIRIDDQRFVLNDDAFLDYLQGFDAVVAGPGPGHPADPADVGLIAKLWSLPEEHPLPVLGICLGFQSLVLDFGAVIERLTEPRHGFVKPILHCGRDIFNDTGDVLATQYHSLHARLGIMPHNVRHNDLWRPSRSCRQLIPLAWDMTDAANGPILMAARHCHKPYWGLQYHPESICTNNEGQKLIGKWWREVCVWQSEHSRRLPLPKVCCKANGSQAYGADEVFDDTAPRKKVQWSAMHLPHNVEVTDILSLVRTDCGDHEPLLLESGMRNGKPVNPETGRFSIIGLHNSQSKHIRYMVSSQRLEVIAGGQVMISRSASIADVFVFLEQFMEEHLRVDGPENVPFWGGLVGYVSYEAGLESIDVEPPKKKTARPDLWFVIVQRSIVVDHVSNQVYVQSILDDDREWLLSIQQRLRQSKAMEAMSSIAANAKVVGEVISSPQGDEYRQKVRMCQDHLRAGSSYELCLTDTTTVVTEEQPWSLYLRLRGLNPAPFGAYLQLSSPGETSPGVTLLSSSPERFLSCSRDGRCQFRPIKGTVKKGPSMTRAKAEQILSSPKEQAENLMIVDLIRHDLNGVKRYVSPLVSKPGEAHSVA